MATKARQQYFADELSLQKQSREFSIADDIQQKIDSVESGAQENVIEIVKVNGTALTPDANKAVDVEVPEVIDNLSSTSADDALSAKQGKILYDYIQNIASRGRFLSNWNCATGLPVTNPTTSPYIYMAGDYYSVSNVATGGGTNYRPDGSSYTIGQASTTAETEVVNVSDFYLYDGTNWLLLVNTERQIAVDSSLSTTSTNPVENRVITNAINGKQNTLTAGTGINIDANNEISNTGVTSVNGRTGAVVTFYNQSTPPLSASNGDFRWVAGTGNGFLQVRVSGDWVRVAPNEVIVSASTPIIPTPTQGQLWYDTTNDVLKTYDGSQWNEVGDVEYSDFEITTATSGATLTISDLTTEFVPTVDFTMSAGTVKEGMQYIVRIDSGATAYTLTLGTGITNPFGEDLTLTASKMTTVVLFATSSSALEVFSVRTAS